MISTHPLDSPGVPTTGMAPGSRDEGVSSPITTIDTSSASTFPSSSSARRANLSVTIPAKRDPAVSISSSSSTDTDSPITILAPAPQTPRSSTFYSSASAEAASAPFPSSSSSSQSSLLPPPTTWIAFRSAHSTSPTSIGRRTATVKRHSSLRLCSTPPPQASLSDNESTSTSCSGSMVTRPSLRRANSVTLGRRPKYDLCPTSSTSATSQSSSTDKTETRTLGSAKPLIPTVPKPYLAPLVCRGGYVESPYFKFEIHLLYQLYHMGFIEEQVVRHVELLLSTTRPGAMHANLRAAFEWYQCHVSRDAEQMMELARRVRTFASYNIYFCKIMSWNDMWIEVSSHTNEVTSQVTKNYRYNPDGVLPAFPPVTGVDQDDAQSHLNSDQDEEANFLSFYGVRSFRSLAQHDQ